MFKNYATFSCPQTLFHYRTGTTVTLSNGGGTFTDSVGVYTAGTGIDITNNVISASDICGLSIGDTYQGGIIFYLDASGCHGLISATTDQSTGVRWYAEDHLALIDWLNESEITTVAMESTGNYWQNLFTALQNAGFEVLLANGKFTKNIKGKKQMYSIVNGYKNYIQSTC
ncbi:MAG: transposase [Crocinitomicaceae bacterium]|nr:transposase [Crocinitomicaceae bacterium]